MQLRKQLAHARAEFAFDRLVAERVELGLLVVVHALLQLGQGFLLQFRGLRNILAKLQPERGHLSFQFYLQRPSRRGRLLSLAVSQEFDFVFEDLNFLLLQLKSVVQVTTLLLLRR